jgi:hypothetical protein
MPAEQPTNSTRRHAIKLGLGGLAALGAMQAVQLDAAPAVSSGGIAGGGRATMEGGEAHLAIFGTRLAIPGQAEEQIVGRVQWFDAGWTSDGTAAQASAGCRCSVASDGGLLLETTDVTAYGPIPDVENGREMRGQMSANGEGSYPFVLRAVDAGPPGTREDTISLLVGAAAEEETPSADGDFSYAAEATLVDGDLQLLSFVIATGS